jgi:hypothetical protein
VTSKRGRGPEWRDQLITKRQLDVLMKTELEMMVSSKKKTVIITHKGEIEVEEFDKGLEGPMERNATSIEEIHKRHVAVVSTDRNPGGTHPCYRLCFSSVSQTMGNRRKTRLFQL